MEGKIQEATDEFKGLIEFVTKEGLAWELHCVEGEIFRRMLRMGRMLLEAFLESVGTGNVGRTLTRDDGEVLSSRRTSPRQYLSIFGEVTIRRAYYHKNGCKGEFPLEAQLNLPKRTYSYLLQKWMTAWGVRTTYVGAVESVKEFLGLEVAHRPIQRMTRDMTEAVNEFTDSLEAPEAGEEGPILIETLDGKGIPMCKPDPAQSKSDEKPGKKKMALVTATFSADPHERRTAEEIAEGLVNGQSRSPGSPKKRRSKPHHKRILASLTQDRSALMHKAQGAALRRIHPHTRLKAVLGDGEKQIWFFASVLFPGWIQILDIIHAMDKLWLAAHLYFQKGSGEAKEFVKERLLALLKGEVDEVIKDFRIALEDGSLSSSKASTLQSKVLGYFVNNRDRMRYDEYLGMGLPIGSGVIEGTCKNLINDRMERSGMRWSREGAEAMLTLRSVYLTELWQDFWAFRTDREKQALYGGRNYLEKAGLVQHDSAMAA